MNIILIILGTICIAYDFIIIFLNPGTFLDIVSSFTHIWTAFGGYLIFVGVYRIKTGHSFWSIWKKWIRITVLSLLTAGGLISIINLCYILNPEVVSMNETADYVILLGGGIDKDGKLPSSVISRVEKAAEYLNANPQSICVATGGTLKWLPYAEAPELKNQLVLRGVDSDRILVEDKAKNTIQNFQLSAKKLAKYENTEISEILKTSIIVITNHYHLSRAERLARRMGFNNIKGLPVKCPAIYVPHNYLREICAYVKLNLKIMLTGKPKRISDK